MAQGLGGGSGGSRWWGCHRRWSSVAGGRQQIRRWLGAWVAHPMAELEHGQQIWEIHFVLENLFSLMVSVNGDTRRPDIEGIGVRWYKDLRNTTSSRQKTKIILVQAP